jgi:branched-chain amino acid transport system ATP-binding protein
LFNVLSGVYKIDEGAITFRGKRIDGLGMSDIVRLGIARTFQNKRLFGTMTVLENVLVSALSDKSGSSLGDVLATRRSKEATVKATEVARRCLAVVGLSELSDSIAKDLPYGAQNRLEIARALAREPSLLLLDEPAAGLNPGERTVLQGLIQRVHESGVTIALVEHDVRMVTGLCARTIVLDHGEKIADADSKAVIADPRVQAAYFGIDEDQEAAHAT